jgi:hypothetical protein
MQQKHFSVMLVYPLNGVIVLLKKACNSNFFFSLHVQDLNEVKIKGRNQMKKKLGNRINL